MLLIPRRPEWARLSPEQLREAEHQSFLEWRRGLAALQEETECIVTPYEKNLEFWRQLWRVIERSDLIVQIVDCRHPLMFRSPDLEKYVKEVSQLKQNLLLVNKSDFLTMDQRKIWAEYFRKENIKFAFFSAITEDAEGLEDEMDSVSNVEAESLDENEDIGDDKKEESLSDLESGDNEEIASGDDVKAVDDDVDPSLNILSSSDLLKLFRYTLCNNIVTQSSHYYHDLDHTNVTSPKVLPLDALAIRMLAKVQQSTSFCPAR